MRLLRRVLQVKIWSCWEIMQTLKLPFHSVPGQRVATATVCFAVNLGHVFSFLFFWDKHISKRYYSYGLQLPFFASHGCIFLVKKIGGHWFSPSFSKEWNENRRCSHDFWQATWKTWFIPIQRYLVHTSLAEKPDLMRPAWLETIPSCCGNLPVVKGIAYITFKKCMWSKEVWMRNFRVTKF